MTWPLIRREMTPTHSYSHYARQAPDAGFHVTQLPGDHTPKVVYVPPYVAPLPKTPDERLDSQWPDRSWYAKALKEPPKLSQKKHTGLGQAVKKWHSLSAENAARNVVSRNYVPYFSDVYEDFREAFQDIPESRRRAVSDALRTLGKASNLLRSVASVRPLAKLLARRSPEDLLRDTQTTKQLMQSFPGDAYDAAVAILAWLEHVSVKSYDDAVKHAGAFIRLYVKDNHWKTGSGNAFFRAATHIGTKHLADALGQVTYLTQHRGWPPWFSVSLLSVLARVPYAERVDLVRQIETAGHTASMGHALAAPCLLSEIHASERDDVAVWLSNFFKEIQEARHPKVFEFFNDLKILPHARRELYLQSLAGCLISAHQPTHRPNDVAVATLWLYYGHIDHRAPLEQAMELRLSNTLRRFMALTHPVEEAPALIHQAKILANAKDGSRAETLEILASVLVSVPPQERARFTAIATDLCEGAPSDSDRISIAQLLAGHAADRWGALGEACGPLRRAGLYPGLVVEGVQMVLRMSTPQTASEVCAAFLEGGMANAAQRNLAYPGAPRPAVSATPTPYRGPPGTAAPAILPPLGDLVASP